jgi:hypothetical protein
MLEDAAKDRKQISRQEFATVCELAGLTDPADLSTLLGYLKQLGTLYHYTSPSGRSPLPGTYVLDPQWVTEGVYSVLTDPVLQSKGGTASKQDFARIFRGKADYPPKAQAFILAMMEADIFEIAFPSPSGADVHLIPELLPANEPEHGIRRSDSINVEFTFSHLPGGLIPRFIVRMHHAIAGQHCWRSGVVLILEGCRVLVRGVSEEKKVYVSAERTGISSRRALTVVRHNLTAAYSHMKHLVVKEFVVPPSGGDPVPFLFLVDLERRKGALAEFPWPGATEDYKVATLLGGIESPVLRETRKPGIVRLQIGDTVVHLPVTGSTSELTKSLTKPPKTRSSRSASQARVKLESSRNTAIYQTSLPRVFISYANEPDLHHAIAVRKLAHALRGWGVESMVDQYVRPMGPNEGWVLWMERAIEGAHYVLMVCSPSYLRRVRGEEKPGTGHGATYEGQLIRGEIYETTPANEKFRAVILDTSHSGCIPKTLSKTTYFKMYEPDGFETLYRAITNQPRVTAPPLGIPRRLT